MESDHRITLLPSSTGLWTTLGSVALLAAAVQLKRGSRSTDSWDWDLPTVEIYRNGRAICVRYAVISGQAGSYSSPALPDEVEIHHATWVDLGADSEEIELTRAEEAEAEARVWADA